MFEWLRERDARGPRPVSVQILDIIRIDKRFSLASRGERLLSLLCRDDTLFYEFWQEYVITNPFQPANAVCGDFAGNHRCIDLS